MSAEGGRAPGIGTIRAMRPEDVTEVSSILRESPEAAKWNAQSLEEALRWPGAVALVAEGGEGLSGFLMGRQTADEAEILNIAVKSNARRRGTGRALLGAALKGFTAQKVRKIFLEVREANATAIQFYQRAGFTQIGKRPQYYRNPEEAGLLMEMKLGD